MRQSLKKENITIACYVMFFYSYMTFTVRGFIHVHYENID